MPSEFVRTALRLAHLIPLFIENFPTTEEERLH